MASLYQYFWSSQSEWRVSSPLCLLQFFSSFVLILKSELKKSRRTNRLEINCNQAYSSNIILLWKYIHIRIKVNIERKPTMRRSFGKGKQMLSNFNFNHTSIRNHEDQLKVSFSFVWQIKIKTQQLFTNSNSLRREHQVFEIELGFRLVELHSFLLILIKYKRLSWLLFTGASNLPYHATNPSRTATPPHTTGDNHWSSNDYRWRQLRQSHFSLWKNIKSWISEKYWKCNFDCHRFIIRSGGFR